MIPHPAPRFAAQRQLERLGFEVEHVHPNGRVYSLSGPTWTAQGPPTYVVRERIEGKPYTGRPIHHFANIAGLCGFALRELERRDVIRWSHDIPEFAPRMRFTPTEAGRKA